MKKPAMKNFVRMLLAISLAISGQQSSADAGEVTEILGVVWESFWQQSGYPRNVFKWRDPIRVKFSGDTADRNREFAMRQLQSVAQVAGIEIAEAAADGAGANLEVEFFDNLKSLPANQPCDTSLIFRNGIIQRAKIRANDGNVWRCLLHEGMHAMGIPGHPYRQSVLTYFARGDKLTETDRLILKTVYSNEVEPGMYPLPALVIIARRLVETAALEDRANTELAAKVFLQNTVKQMEDFAAGAGDLPVVVLRSGRATSVGLASGRVQTQFLLGVAYTRGHIVEVDNAKAVAWLTKAAASAHAGAQFLLGEAYFRGAGVERDPVEGYKWCFLAAGKGVLNAKNALRDMESQLQPEQISEGKARAEAWAQTKS